MSASRRLAGLAVIDENIPSVAADTRPAVGNKNKMKPRQFPRTIRRETIDGPFDLWSITSPVALIFRCLRSHLSVPFRQQPQRSGGGALAAAAGAGAAHSVVHWSRSRPEIQIVSRDCGQGNSSDLGDLMMSLTRYEK